MARIKTVLASVTGAIAFAAIAEAADMPGPPPYEPAPIVRPLSGWYLRGDIGYRSGVIRGAESGGGFTAPSDSKLSGVAFGGVGAGFKWNWIRADLTADFAPTANYTGNYSAGGTASAKIQSINTLLNIYYDLGTWAQITPYIGAGVGGAYLRTSSYQNTAFPPATPVADHTRLNLAWAVMAGASYQFLPNLSVDAGYRYLNQGDLEIAPASVGGQTLKGLAAHEFRIGLRWTYD